MDGWLQVSRLSACARRLPPPDRSLKIGFNQRAYASPDSGLLHWSACVHVRVRIRLLHWSACVHESDFRLLHWSACARAEARPLVSRKVAAPANWQTKVLANIQVLHALCAVSHACARCAALSSGLAVLPV
jgi:hypothetical protein